MVKLSQKMKAENGVLPISEELKKTVKTFYESDK